MPAIYKNGNIYGGGGSGGGTAATTTFDDTNVEFSANNVQDAFEEVTKTLTQQEYDALSTAEKNNGTIYFISDGTATNVVECTQATYPATPEQDTFYLISDAPSLQGTSADLLYESGSAVTTKAKIDSKADSSSLATVATTGAYSDLSGKPTIPTVDASISLSSTNAVQNKAITSANFFGNNGTYYSMSKTSVDAIVADVSTERYFSVDNLGEISGYGNRQFVYGWVNSTRKYGWVMICSFGGMGFGRRHNADSFTITKLVG